jgi:predicted Zn finger-like uncharacterized protein
MNLNCKYCKHKLDIDNEEISIENKLIKCTNCNQEWIYASKSEYLLDKIEELDFNWQQKEISLTEQLNNYNSKIEELDKDLKSKYAELSEQEIIENRIMLFEKRITNTEKINAKQGELEIKIKQMKNELKEISDKISNKNKDFENKANYLEMKINSSVIISNKDKKLNEEIVNISKFDQREKIKETTKKQKAKKLSFWRG